MSEAVYNGYDRDAFEWQYNARLQVDDAEERMQALAERSATFRANASGAHLDIPYGPAGRERLDVFPGDVDKGPVLIFVHGGYWRSRERRDFSFVAEPLTRAGATVVVAGYSLCPHVTIDQIVRQLRMVCAWAWKNIDDYGGDHHHLHAAGHSAGGHLTGMLAATEWPEVDHALPEDLLKGAMSMSGLFDLEPLLHHSINDDVNMDSACAKRNSPLRLTPTLSGPFIGAVGGNESDEFRRQSRLLTDAWKTAGANVEYVEVAGRDHFSIVGDLLDPDYVLYRRLKTLMGL